MANFTTRVELHDATWSDYLALHVEMKKKGFLLTITSDDGKVYELPPAEYTYEGYVTRDQVFEGAKSAASVIKKSFAVLVTQGAGRTWCGLKLVA